MIEHNVLIGKDPMVKLVRNAVNAAELLILESVHQEGAVEITKTYELDDKFASAFDPDAELERLRTRYKPRGGAPSAVDKAFPNGARDIARVCGVVYAGSGIRERAPRSEVNLGESREKVVQRKSRKAPDAPLEEAAQAA